MKIYNLLNVLLAVTTASVGLTHGVTKDAYTVPTQEFLQCFLERSELLELSHNAFLEIKGLKAEKKDLKEELVKMNQERLDLTHD